MKKFFSFFFRFNWMLDDQYQKSECSIILKCRSARHSPHFLHHFNLRIGATKYKKKIPEEKRTNINSILNKIFSQCQQPLGSNDLLFTHKDFVLFYLFFILASISIRFSTKTFMSQCQYNIYPLPCIFVWKGNFPAISPGSTAF